MSLIKMATDTPRFGLQRSAQHRKSTIRHTRHIPIRSDSVFFGAIVRFIADLVFSFNYCSHLKWKIGIFGGICATAHSLFPANQGHQGSHSRRGTQSLDTWPHDGHNTLLSGRIHTPHAIAHALRVNVLKVIVMMGTFALAMAFCRQRPRRISSECRCRVFRLHRLCRQWQWRSTHISRRGTQRPVGHIRVVSDPSRSDHGLSLATSRKARKALSDRNPDWDHRRQAMDVRIVAHRTPVLCAGPYIWSTGRETPLAFGTPLDQPTLQH